MSGIEAVMSTLRRVVPNRDQGTAMFECRQCGTTVDQDTEACPACDSTEIIKYIL